MSAPIRRPSVLSSIIGPTPAAPEPALVMPVASRTVDQQPPTPTAPQKAKKPFVHKVHVALEAAEMDLLDQEIHRRRQSGQRGRGKTDYASIVREALAFYWAHR